MTRKITFIVVITSIIVIFSIQNIRAINVKFLIWNLTISNVIVVLGSFAIGIFAGTLISQKKKVRKRRRMLRSA